jgi:hypothetical protein
MRCLSAIENPTSAPDGLSLIAPFKNFIDLGDVLACADVRVSLARVRIPAANYPFREIMNPES